MAFKSAKKASGYTSNGITVAAPDGLVAGDVIIAQCIFDSTDVSIVPPSGFTEILSSPLAGPDHNGWNVFAKIATGSEPTTYTFGLPTYSYNVVEIAAWSGRSTTSVSSILTSGKYTLNTSETANSYPFSTSSPTLTATSGDDLLLFTVLDTGDTGTITATAPTGFTTAIFEGDEDYANGGIFYKNAASAGATGTITSGYAGSGSGSGWGALLIALPSSSAITIDTLVFSLGSTSNTITTTGLSTLTALTIGSVSATSLSATGGDGTFSLPALAAGQTLPLFGSTVTATATASGGSTTLAVPFPAPTGWQLTVLTSVPSTAGYIGAYVTGVAIGDIVISQTAATLGVTSNGVDADGRIYSDGYGTQQMYVQKASTGFIDGLSVLFPGLADVSIALTGVSGTGTRGTLAPAISNTKAITGVNGTGSLGSLTVTAIRNRSGTLTGLSGTGALGTLVRSGGATKVLTGNAGAGSLGSLSVTTGTPTGANVSLGGVTATGAIATLVPAASAVEALTAVTGVGAVGDLVVSADVNTSVTGRTASGVVGSLTVGLSSNVLLGGVSAAGYVGTINFGGSVSMLINGVRGQSAIGTLNVVSTVAYASSRTLYVYS